ncbi:hypothetical protein CBD41_07010 [bacterium TMED181]|nr:hypothetical protein [Planctomycetota bacterium]OUW43575.1 MAG: hypothetical protein CBD41_07010 [bacterium TMED181]
MKPLGLMKIAILGSCLAGMSLSLRLLKSQHEVSIWSPFPSLNSEGPGYLVNTVTLTSLKSLGLNIEPFEVPLYGGKAIDLFDSSTPHNSGLLFALDRNKLHQEFYRLLGAERFHFDSHFSHFEPTLEYHAQRARFKDGRYTRADLFVGADGTQSAVRKKHVAGPELSQSMTVQISGVSIVDPDSPLQKKVVKTFIDTKNEAEILTFPSTDSKCSWAIQFNALHLLLENPDDDHQCHRLLNSFASDWPQELRMLFAEGSIQNLCYRKCSDRRLPHLFHKDNVILIGEAAHPTLPSLTTGTDSDLEDAMDLGDLITDYSRGYFPSIDVCLTEFTRQRRPVLGARIRRARKDRDQFLSKCSAKSQPISSGR